MINGRGVKAVGGLATIFAAIFFIGGLSQRVTAVETQNVRDREVGALVIEMKTDLKYIRRGVDKLERDIEKIQQE